MPIEAATGVAVVIPIYRQPGLAIEAIASALREAEASDGVVVLVNDGCPFAETHTLCLEFASAHPTRIDYLRTANGGLSAARNRGIQHALARFPAIAGVFLLDADNRVKPGAMRRALRALRETGADWVYPDVDKFGEEWHGDMSGPYSILRHLFQNICDAGCLVHRRVFETPPGLRFDETLRDGYEDWDFWLRCALAGRRGAHYRDGGFQYRARRESMVREADRSRARITAAMQLRLRALYRPASVLLLEHQEAPRFCIIHDERGGQPYYDFTSAPGASSRRGAMGELERLFWRAASHPVAQHFPPFVARLDRVALLELQRLLLVDWLFWQIETLLERCPVVAVRLIASDNPIACALAASDDGPAHVMATRFTTLRDDLAGAETNQITLRVTAPFTAHFASAELGPLRAMLAATGWRATVDGAPDWRRSPLISGHELYGHVRTMLGARGPLARGAGDGDGQPDVALLVPTALAPGQPDGHAATSLARALRLRGWRARLIVAGPWSGPLIAESGTLRWLFDAVCFLDTTAGPDGTGAAGLVAGCTALVDCGTATGLALVGEMRRQGVVTACVVTPDGTRIATALASEHALDLVAAATPETLALCQAHGMPTEKLALLDQGTDSFADLATRLTEAARRSKAPAIH